MKVGNAETALRYVAMVRCMPVGRWVSTLQVQAALAETGYEVTKRTVARDMLKLARPFGLDLRGDRLAGYHWRRTRALDEVG